MRYFDAQQNRFRGKKNRVNPVFLTAHSRKSHTLKMQKPRLISSITRGGIVIALCSFGSVFANDSNYLDAIAPDATDDQVTSAKTVEQVTGGAADDNTFKDGLDLPGFEESLRSHFTGSFMFYSKLDETKKKAVYEQYLLTKDISLIRKKIISLFSSR